MYRRHAHVEQPDRRRDDVVGMQRDTDHMAGNCRPHTDLCRRLVTHFTHQNDIRVLTQGRTQHALETKIDLVMYLDLIDAGQAVFDRIFDRNDLLFRWCSTRRAPHTGSSFSAPGRPRHQDHAARAPHRMAQAFKHARAY